MGYIAGHYTATWNSVDIGSTREGIRLINRHHQQPVQDDAFGEMAPDGIQQGVDTYLELDSIEYDKVEAAIYAQTSGEGKGNINVGKLLSGLAHPLVLTPKAGTPAASLTTPGYNFPLVIVEDDLDVLLASKLRQGRLRFHAYPDPSSGRTYTRV